MTKNARLISYLRVSDVGDREGDSFQSVEQQREANKSYAALRGCSIVAEVSALNASGGKSWPEPLLREIIAQVDRGDADSPDGVIVYALDRWGRSLESLATIERWADEGKTFLSASEQFDATTASGRMVLRMMMVVARYYWEQIKERFALSQRHAIKRGAFIGPTPYGYLRLDNGCLEIDPITGPMMTEAFRRAATDDIHSAAQYLNRDTADTRRMLSSRVYLGEVIHAVRDGHRRKVLRPQISP